MKEYVIKELRKSASLIDMIMEDKSLISTIVESSKLCINALENNNKIMLAGNGGSAADSQHIAAELVSRFNFDRPGLPAMALTTDTSILTATGNDYGYEEVFARQIQANGREGDIFIAYSTSGNSPNILKALDIATSEGIKSIGLTGNKGGLMNKSCDYLIAVPASETPKIQEGHAIIGHIICGLIEETIFSHLKQ